MNVSYDWLRAFAPFSQSPAELRELLTTHAVTVDELLPLRQDLAPIVIARVVEEAPHPDSDHLHVTKVDAGTGTLIDVVCGAPNVTAGKLYPFAPTGTVVAGGKRIEKRRIRGALSNGMLCSEVELGLGTDAAGIMELDVDVAPGTPLLQALSVGDSRLVLDVGANRPDLLSHLGVAREVAALTGSPLAYPEVEGLTGDVPSSQRALMEGQAGSVSVRIEEGGLVNRFMGVVIRGVTIGPSPDWIRRRLEAVGSRSINNVVDASNYVLHELGQPTHAFDLAKLAGSNIVVRRATHGERITTLDGTDRALTSEMIVIADARRAQAIAGIMGGRASEVTEGTTDIFVEVANFDPQRIRRARGELGMSTDASYRFERGVDINVAPSALTRVAQLILALAGGAVEGAPVDLAENDPPSTMLSLRPTRVSVVLGDGVPRQEITTLLQSVGFSSRPDENGESLRVQVPSWRADVTAEIDLIEEVARLRGYDSFPDEIRPARPGNVPDDPQWLCARRVRELLVGNGLLEVRPMPFVAGREDDAFVRVSNPLAENEAFLRRELLDTLARRAEYNLARSEGNLRLFEIGSAFERRAGQELPREELRVAFLVMGRRRPEHFTDPKSAEFGQWIVYTEWDAKAIAQDTASAAYPDGKIELTESEDPSVLWRILVNGDLAGIIRRIVLDAPVWAAPAFGAELSLGVIESAQVAPPGASALRPPQWPVRAVRRYEPLPLTPPSDFDLALVVPETLSAGAIESVMRDVAGDLLEGLTLFDEYTGHGVEVGHRSLAWRLTFRHPERTLREKEIEGRRAKILGALADKLNVRPRAT